MTKKLVIIFIALVLVSTSTTFAMKKNTINENTIDDVTLRDYMIRRARFINKKSIENKIDLNYDDLATEEEIENRVSLIIEKARDYNYIYPDINYQQVALDFFAIVEHESSFVNYAELDDGLSGGIISMRFSTAKEESKKLDLSYNKTKFIQNMDYQITLGIYHYYKLIEKYDGDRRNAWTAYNTGSNFKIKEHWLDYTFQIEGKISYYEEQLNID